MEGKRGPGRASTQACGSREAPPSILVRQRKTGAWSPKSCWTPTPPLVGTQAKLQAAIWAWPKQGWQNICPCSVFLSYPGHGPVRSECQAAKPTPTTASILCLRKDPGDPLQDMWTSQALGSCLNLQRLVWPQSGLHLSLSFLICEIRSEYLFYPDTGN